jgi:hypothetical protein
LQIADQVGPEIHQLTLALGLQALAFEMGGTALPIPEGLPRGAAVAPVGQAEAERFRAGQAIELPQASALQQLAGGYGGDAVEAADFREGQPLGKRGGRRHDEGVSHRCPHACQENNDVNSSSRDCRMLSLLLSFIQESTPVAVASQRS